MNRLPIDNHPAAEDPLMGEDCYRSLVELSPHMVAIHSRGKIVYVNPAGIKMLGAAGPEDLIGKPSLKIIHPGYIGIVKKRIKLLEEGKTLPLLEEKYIRLDGKILDVEVAAGPIPFQGRMMFQTIVRDITEPKQAEEGLRKH